jgi:hypothetical protein
LPSSLLEIGEESFRGCHGLKGIELPLSLQKLRARAFRNCIGLTDVPKFPPFLASIADDAFEGCDGLIGVQEAIQQHRKQYKQWKARCNVLCCISRVDSDYRLEVVENDGLLGSATSNAFLARFPLDGQIIFLATTFVDGEGKLANGISRHIFSYLPNA